MAKLFPKLVSFLAVLLLCQFGYVACQPTGVFIPSRKATLPADEAKALDGLMTTLGWYTSQQFSGSPCDNNFLGITCNCTYENSTVCHVTGLSLSYNKLSSQIPKELGNLSNLEIMYLGFNELTGQLPPELGELKSLYHLFLTGNMLNGTVPSWFGLVHISYLIRDLGFNELTGQLPPQLGELKYLNHLDVGSNNLSGELPGNYANFSTWDQLRWFSVAGNRLTGQVPKFIANWNGLSYLDLSFNNLTGGIPDSMEKLNLSKMFLTGNMLNGTVPSWVTDNIEDKADLSYNNFEIPRDGPKKGEGKLNIEPNRNSIRDLTDKCRGKPKYDSLYINCGGEGTVFDRKEFEADSATSNYYSAPRKNWAYSCSGDFGSKTYDSSDYIKNVDCGVCDSAATPLYSSTRLCPLSLTYYGFCLFKGNYTVKLYFAETVYQSDEDYSNLGKRVFDVYIQGNRTLKDFNIKEMASGTNKTWSKDFSAYVGDDHLLTIHFFRAGKGTFLEPRFFNSPAALSLNGPLVSGISVTANFKVGGKKLSPSQIAGIIAGSVFASLLLSAYMWKKNNGLAAAKRFE
ncbi:hypothetical protein D5086_028691, partial [Populus alba]